MAGGRPILALLALILIAGGIVLEIFVILSGAVSGTPLNKVFFLSASTSGIGSSPTTAAWTYFSLCDLVGSDTTACGTVKAAFPFNPTQNFGVTTGIPAAFVGTNKFYYLSRFAWAFYLVALFFAALALFTGLLALCSRLGGYLSGLTSMLAAFFMATAAALMTAWTVIARNDFRADGISANLGRYAYGFTWAAFACYFLAMTMFCSAGAAGGKKDKVPREKKSMFGGGRKASTRSRASGVKEDYSSQTSFTRVGV